MQLMRQQLKLWLLRGLALANELGVNRIIIQSDCLEAIEVLQAGAFSSTSAAPYYDDICIQATTFGKVCFSFCSRDANYVAHHLAKEAEINPCVWVDEPPSFIVHFLVDDVTTI